jgi:hypothetical protein
MSPAWTLLGTFLAIHVVVLVAAAARLLTALLAALLTAGLLTTTLAALLTTGLLTTLLLATLLTTLLTATAFAMTLTLLARLIPLPSLVLSRPLLALGLVSGLLRSFRLLGVVRHIDSPRMLKADDETASTVEPAATGRM